MPSLATAAWSSIGKKILLGATGLLLILFLMVHLAGNLALFAGPEAYNAYSAALGGNPLIWIARLGLLVGFVVHFVWAIQNYLKNRGARPERYELTAWARWTSRKSLASTSMILSGLVLLVFIPLHIWNFALATHEVTASGVNDLYGAVVSDFQGIGTVIWYEIAMIVVGMHVWHGFSSAFQSLGADHPKYTPFLRSFGWFLAIVIGGGFFVLPILTLVGVIGGGVS